MSCAGLLSALVLAALLPCCAVVWHGGHQEARGLFLEPAPGHEERAVAAFTRILVEGPIDVTVTVAVAVGRCAPLALEGDAGRLDEVAADVQGGTLFLSLPHGTRPFREQPRARVATARLDSLVAAGSGWVIVSGLDQERFDVEARGSGDVLLRGKVGELRVRIEGAGDIDAAGLEAARVLTSGGGHGRMRGRSAAGGSGAPPR